MNDREHFFKYMSAGTARAVLTNRTLRWSTPATLNDPHDMQFDLRHEVDRGKVQRMTMDKLWEAYNGEAVKIGNVVGHMMQWLRTVSPGLSRQEFEAQRSDAAYLGLDKLDELLPEVNQAARDLLAKAKILCLTETPENSAMWTHYADEHRGAVIRLRSYPELDSPYSAAEPIQYVEDAPRFADEEFLSDMYAGRVSLEPGPIIHRLVYTKSADWAYEREWRIYSGDGRDPNAPYEDIHFAARELDAVIFGMKMPADERIELSRIIRERYPHAEILQASKADGGFKMRFDPIPD